MIFEKKYNNRVIQMIKTLNVATLKGPIALKASGTEAWVKECLIDLGIRGEGADEPKFEAELCVEPLKHGLGQVKVSVRLGHAAQCDRCGSRVDFGLNTEQEFKLRERQSQSMAAKDADLESDELDDVLLNDGILDLKQVLIDAVNAELPQRFFCDQTLNPCEELTAKQLAELNETKEEASQKDGRHFPFAKLKDLI